MGRFRKAIAAGFGAGVAVFGALAGAAHTDQILDLAAACAAAIVVGALTYALPNDPSVIAGGGG
jgi:hypothetical protein